MTTMEDLTKTQIVLLTLLVSFITSIATGIITTSLLAQAPQGVTQTIDRVVERTVERVAPTTSTGAQTVREVTVVKEGDAIVASVEAAQKAVVRIQSPAAVDGVQSFYGLGVIVNKQGLVLSDQRQVIENGTYTMVFSDGTTLPASFVARGTSGSMVLFKIIADDAKLRSLTPVVLSTTNPKLGQTVIAIAGAQKTSIAVGRVLSLDADTGTALTDLNPANETQGGPLLNLSGELIGLKTSNADLTITASVYTTISPLSKFIASRS